ncbi:MAG: Crp/Fnr family transcriptional regulator [Gammaproteobacteria bacterium]|nr:Crp/Fnr family transcriptional regulator [Gammaproteobacteria bacterium]
MTRKIIEISAGVLSAVEIFYDLSFNERKMIADKCRGLQFDEGDIITTHDDTGGDVYFIISGKVRVAIYTVSGREISFGEQVAGEMFGDIYALDKKSRSPYVISLDNTTLAAMSAENFLWVLQLYPSVMSRTFMRLAQLVRLLSRRIVEFSSLDVRDRLHAELLRLAWKNMNNSNTATISPAPRHVELANRISTHREAISREMTELASSGLIRKRKNRLYINDVIKLENMVRDTTGNYDNNEHPDEI